MERKLPFTRKEAKAWVNKNVVGWYECPLTPMTKDFKIDEQGIQHNLDAYVEMGENGLVLGGFVAEAWNMKLSDWMNYHKVYAEANRGRLPLWTIILDPSVHQALEKLHFVQELGYVGAEVINPVVQLKSDDEIYNYFKYMTDNSDMAIVLYRTAVSGKLIGTDLIKRLADLDTVVGVKQGSGNHADSLQLRRDVRSDFIVSDPLEDFWWDDLRHGGQVLWGGFTHIIFGKKRKVLDDYTRMVKEGKYEEAYQLSESLEPVRAVYRRYFMEPLFRTASYASSIANIKAWYEAIGLKGGSMLPPVKSLSEQEASVIREELSKAGVV